MDFCSDARHGRSDAVPMPENHGVSRRTANPLIDRSRLFRQHDWDATADQISELGRARDQLVSNSSGPLVTGHTVPAVSNRRRASPSLDPF